MLFVVLAVLLTTETPGHGNERSFRLDALIWAETNPPPDFPPISPTRRVAEPSTVQFIWVEAIIRCTLPDGAPHLVRADLRSFHELVFYSDDDVSDGFGTVEPTDANRSLRDNLAIEVGDEGSVAGANVDIAVVSGSFHRLGAVVEVDLRLDIAVEGDPDNLPDNGDEEPRCDTLDHAVKAWLVVTPDLDTSPSSGFFLNGVARSSSPNSQNTIRETCRAVSELTLPTLPEDNVVCAYA